MRLFLLAHGATWDRRFQVSSLAASAAAVGDRVEVALFFAALDAWVRGGWDRLDPDPPVTPERIEALGFPPLSSLLEGARGSGNLRLSACSASMRLLDLEPARVQERVDLICGWQSFARRIAEADHVLSF